VVVELNTKVWGSGGDRRVLLLHGITSSVAGWWRVARDLEQLGWEVTAADLRGHGDSPNPGSYLFEEHTADVLALGGSWDAVIGHSMGGTIAVLAATADPQFAEGLVLLDPALMLPEPKSEMLDWLLGEYLIDTDPARLREMNPRWHGQDVVAKVEAIDKTSADMVRATVEDNWPWMALEEAAALSTPTVVLGSDPLTGGIFPVAFGEWLASSPLIEFEMIANSTHSAHRNDDQYETYLSTLVGALDRLPTLRG
jgi:pimeloyl-ACP methyl ester carboxylesterase